MFDGLNEKIAIRAYLGYTVVNLKIYFSKSAVDRKLDGPYGRNAEKGCQRSIRTQEASLEISLCSRSFYDLFRTADGGP